jgi:RNA polymerase sigma-70 factor (ECF subfamily)
VERADILARLRERILRFAASRMERTQAEDLAQETLMVVHEKYGHLEAIEDLVPLSMEICRLKMMAARRKSARRGEHSSVSVDDLPLAARDPDPALLAQRHEQLERLERALAELDGRCRELFRWKLEGYTFSEIQAKMEADSINTIYTWDLRCRKRLLEKLGGRLEVD